MTDNNAFRIISRELAGRLLVAWLILAWACLPGCATVDSHTAPSDWPTLTVRDNVVSGAQVIRRCYKYVPTWAKLLGTFPMACAEINFAALTCDIWRAHDASPEMLEHELIHCAGGQHPGDTTLADAWMQYKAYVAGAAIARRAP